MLSARFLLPTAHTIWLEDAQSQILFRVVERATITIAAVLVLNETLKSHSMA